jgi:hypothetical protein
LEVSALRNPFRTQPAVVGAADPSEAYREGRADERDRLDPDHVVAPNAATASAASAADLKAAFQRGRERERAARRGSPVFNFLILIAVAAAALFVYLAIQNGSFSNGGAVVDRNLDQAAHEVNAPIKGAALKAGDALQKAGNSLK